MSKIKSNTRLGITINIVKAAVVFGNCDGIKTLSNKSQNEHTFTIWGSQCIHLQRSVSEICYEDICVIIDCEYWTVDGASM